MPPALADLASVEKERFAAAGRSAIDAHVAIEARRQQVDDRCHARDLVTPREVRTALVYVLQTVRKHGFTESGGYFDPLTSAIRFDGFISPVLHSPDPNPFSRRESRTWLLGEGWIGGGLSPSERPAS